MLRLAAKGLVPDDVLTRKKRGFFNEAVGAWLADDDGAVVTEILLAPEPALARVLDVDAVHAAVAVVARRRHESRAAAAGADHARAVARRVPAARVRQGAARVRARSRMSALTYAIVTPARDEEHNLARLAAALVAQTQPPLEWVVVDDGSTDGTAALVRELGAARTRGSGCTREAQREEGGIEQGRRHGRASTRFRRGVHELLGVPDVVVKVDADVDVDPDYFEQLIERFADDPLLGIASGTCYELEDGEWVRRTKVESTVWGASRAYRWSCVPDVMALEPSMGWDGLDELKVQLRGMHTQAFIDLPFRHHRPEGGRELQPPAPGRGPRQGLLVHGLPPELPRAALGLPGARGAGRAGDDVGLRHVGADAQPALPRRAARARAARASAPGARAAARRAVVLSAEREAPETGHPHRRDRDRRRRGRGDPGGDAARRRRHERRRGRPRGDGRERRAAVRIDVHALRLVRGGLRGSEPGAARHDRGGPLPGAAPAGGRARGDERPGGLRARRRRRRHDRR